MMTTDETSLGSDYYRRAEARALSNVRGAATGIKPHKPLDNLDGAVGAVAGLSSRMEALADRLLGPENAAGEAQEPPRPSGFFDRIDDAAARIRTSLARMNVLIDRIEAKF